MAIGVDATDKDDYNPTAITTTTPWTDFTLTTILARYGDVLRNARIQSDPFASSPPRSILCYSVLRARVWDFVHPRVRRGLRCGIEYLSTDGEQAGMVPLCFDIDADDKKAHTPDAGYFDSRALVGEAPNRAPGVYVPSWVWGSDMVTAAAEGEDEAGENAKAMYYAVLSRVAFYMEENGAKYGFVLTDEELVVVRLGGRLGEMEVGESVKWGVGGSDEEPVMTVLLGLWYLGMIASE
ncbi:hypothetical protein AWENTII_001111 [Aspergillus wentii]